MTAREFVAQLDETNQAVLRRLEPEATLKPEVSGALNPAQRDRFFEALVAAALRLDRLQFREWLWKRLRSRPLVAVDPAAFALSDGDMAALLKTLANDPRPAHAQGPQDGPLSRSLPR